MKEHDVIFKFQDPIEFLNFTFESKRLKNNRFSLRAWAYQLGYKNPSFLSHVLKKQRTLKLDLAEKIGDNIKLTGKAKKYFEILVLLQNSKTVEEKNLYLDLLETLKPQREKTPQSVGADVFRVISDWHHTAILELVELADFKFDLEYISKRLNENISVQNIRKAIDRLLKLELLEEKANGQLKRVRDNPILHESFVPSEAIRHFHKQMIEKATASIDGQDLDERDIRGSMISIRAKDYAAIQKIIKQAHSDIVKFSRDGDGEEVYQFNTQFFKLTKEVL
ncbi:MAG TPA: TIGR02147 family protein [Bdellovibrio sp.]|nr:TIGR02147 family protein [Bdellovibrio sp.]